MVRDENMIAALKRERAAYVAQGKADRVSQVDEQLAHYGHVEPETPQGRTSPEGQQQTAAQSEPATPAEPPKATARGRAKATPQE
jgi:hypothetical protein